MIGEPKGKKIKPNKQKKDKVDVNVLHLRNISEIITLLIENYEKRNKIHLHTLIS